MAPMLSKPDTDPTPQPSLKRWEAPAIVLERSLEVAAQGGPPQPYAAPNGSGFLGPLGTSGNSGDCM
jgi:hypothetical protein